MGTGRPPGGPAATRRPSRPTRRSSRRSGSARRAPPNDKKSRGDPGPDEPDDHAIGRSRGGLTTKVHALTDGHGRVLAFRLTGGNVHDSRTFVPLLEAVRVPRVGAGRPRTRPDYLLADKAHSSRVARGLLRRRGIAHTIAEPDDQKASRRRKGSAGGRPVGFDPPATPSATPSNEASASSNNGAAWPPATTSTRRTTPPRSASQSY